MLLKAVSITKCCPVSSNLVSNKVYAIVATNIRHVYALLTKFLKRASYPSAAWKLKPKKLKDQNENKPWQQEKLSFQSR